MRNGRLFLGAALVTGTFFVCSTVRPVKAADRLPVPELAAQERSSAQIRDVFKTEWAAAKTPAGKAELAKKLLQVGITTRNDATGRFVLLRVARDMAAQAGDIDTAFAAIGELDKEYAVTASSLKADVLVVISNSSAAAAVQAKVARAACAIVDSALAADDFELAQKLSDIAKRSGVKAKDPALLKQVQAQSSLVDALLKDLPEFQAAQKTLAEKPTDPAANLLVGKFRCLLKNDWKGGLSFLALGADKNLAELATSELKQPNSAEAMVALGDGWWSRADQETGAARDYYRWHAGDWYRAALPQTSGLDKARIEKRLQESEPPPGRLALARNEAATQGTLATAKPDRVPPSVSPPAGGNTSPMRQLQLESARKSKVPVEVVNSLGMKFIWIPPGKFTMGSPPNEPDRDHNREAQVEVTLTKPFYMATTTVTQGAWKQLMKNEPWKGRESVKEGANVAASYLSRDDALSFCKTLTEAEGKFYRLPTDAEWEYSCRAGTTTAFSFGDDASRIDEFGWWGSRSEGGNTKTEQYAHEVALKKPNPFGLYDMHGNVTEWCEDLFSNKLPGGADPVVLTADAPNFVQRGGAWDYPAGSSRSAARMMYPTFRLRSTGFRVVLDPKIP